MGYVARQRVPALVAGFDVCLAPFLTGAVADSVSPLKLYEYLALGKPVVEIFPMAGVKADPVGAFVYFGQGADSFVALVGGVLRGDIPEPSGAAEFVGEYTWDRLYGRLRALLGEELLET